MCNTRKGPSGPFFVATETASRSFKQDISRVAKQPRNIPPALQNGEHLHRSDTWQSITRFASCSTCATKSPSRLVTKHKHASDPHHVLTLAGPQIRLVASPSWAGMSTMLLNSNSPSPSYAKSHELQLNSAACRVTALCGERKCMILKIFGGCYGNEG